MTEGLDPRSDRPLALQLADVIRAEIQDGRRQAGSQLPTESEFQDTHGVSRTTIRSALATLAAEGLVLTRKGYGSYVREQRPLRRVSSARRHDLRRQSGKPEFDIQAIDQGLVPSRRILKIGREPAPRDIAEWLRLPAGQEVVVRRRLQFLGGEPAILSTSYYPLWVAEGSRLESPDALPEGPDTAIEELGHVFTRGIEVFNARMPSPDEVRTLELSPGIPVVRMISVDYDADDRPLQLADDLFAGDRHEFASEWSVNERSGDE
jgi:GntR family transcriptional regulator